MEPTMSEDFLTNRGDNWRVGRRLMDKSVVGTNGERDAETERFVRVSGAREHNLKDVRSKFPAMRWWYARACLDPASRRLLLGRYMRKPSGVISNLSRHTPVVCTENLSSGVAVVKSAKDGV